MVRIVEAENAITCSECGRNLSFKEDDVFLTKYSPVDTEITTTNV